MKTDLYTKTVLTIIAICLSVIMLKQVDIIPHAYAAESPNNHPKYSVVPLNANGTLDVNIKSSSSTMNVNLVDINTSDELDVNIDEVGGRSTYGRIPVDVK